MLEYIKFGRGGGKLQNIHLSHFTGESVSSQIINDEKLHTSIHNPPSSVQWLGDGVYFYNTLCEKSKRQGLSLAKGKYTKDSKLSEIQISITIDKDQLLDLQNPNHLEKITKELNIMAEQYAEVGWDHFIRTITKYLTVLEHIGEFQPFSNEKYGSTLGEMVNTIKLRDSISFSCIKCKFYAVSDKAQASMPGNWFYNNRDKNKRNSVMQFCVNDLELIPIIDQACLTYHDL